MKSTINFKLDFTTSKLLAYIVVILSAVLGYLLTSTEVVIVGFTIGSALSGVKGILDNKIAIADSKNVAANLKNEITEINKDCNN